MARGGEYFLCRLSLDIFPHKMLPPRIQDYLLIGDLHSAALVSKRASIDWLCYPQFDSPSVFGKILDNKKGGSFFVMADEYETTSGYQGNTAIAETLFSSPEHEFRVRDFMLPRPERVCGSQLLARNVAGKKGNKTISFCFSPRPDYARKSPVYEWDGKRLVAYIEQRGRFLLHLPEGTEFKIEGDDVFFSFSLEEGETKNIVLEYCLFGQSMYSDANLEQETRNFWHNWISKGKFYDFCRSGLLRSAITIKLMQFYPTGAMVAAPTTSLPEEMGGERNWDYRYVWIRDAMFGLYAFTVLGYVEEAKMLFQFVEHLFVDKDDWNFSVLYALNGTDSTKEEILDHLEGFRGSGPVRRGNEAAEQLQLDMYGTLIDAYFFTTKHYEEIPDHSARVIKYLVKKIEENWKKPDSGIWEARNEPKHYTYSKVMCWVGMHRALKLCEKLKISEEEKARWEAMEKEIHDWIWEHCYDKELKTLVQYPGAKHQDATNFLFVILHFLDKKDPRTREVLEATTKELVKDDIFVYRYLAEDGLQGEEGVFVLCTFWLISAWARLEEVDYASELFEKFEKYIAPHGLLAEEVDPKTGEYLGNYPQFFSHLGYVMAAHYLMKYLQRAGKLPKEYGCDIHMYP